MYLFAIFIIIHIYLFQHFDDSNKTFRILLFHVFLYCFFSYTFLCFRHLNKYIWQDLLMKGTKKRCFEILHV